MTKPISIVIPALSDVDLFEKHLPPIMAEVERRDVGDEVIVVDDTGEDILRPWFAVEHPVVRGVVHKKSHGYAKALISGARVAKQDLLLYASPETLVREGFIEPLAAAMRDPKVYAVSPRVLDSEGRTLSLRSLEMVNGLPRLVDRDPEHVTKTVQPIVCATRSAFMLRRKEFLEIGGIAPISSPYHGDPLDLCLEAWRRGRRVVEVADAVVETHPREHDEGETDMIRATVEKNRLLTVWKHVDDAALACEHVAALWRGLLDPEREGWREELEWLVLALDQLTEVEHARGKAGERKFGFVEMLRSSSPAEESEEASAA